VLKQFPFIFKRLHESRHLFQHLVPYKYTHTHTTQSEIQTMVWGFLLYRVLSTSGSSHRKRASAGTYRVTCHAQGNDTTDTVTDVRHASYV